MQQEKKLFSNKALVSLILPLALQSALSLIVGMADSIMVSSAGEASVSGVSLIDTVMVLVFYVFSAMAAGGAVVAGQLLGSGDKKRANHAADELLWLNGVIAIVVTVIVFVLSGWITGSLFGEIAADVEQAAKDYLFFTVFSIPAIGIFEAAAAVFRTMGDTKTTLKLSLLMNGINVCGNAILIYGCNMGAAGAAIATLIARWIAAVIVVILLLDQKRELHIQKTLRHKFDWALIRQIAGVGIPGGIENGLFQLGKIVLVGLVTKFGTSAIAANTITQTLASIEVIPSGAIQTAMVTVIARCIGAGDYDQARYYNRRLILVAMVCNAVWGAALYLSLPVILLLYSNLTEETVQLTRQMFFWHTAGAAIIWPFAFVQPSSLRAAGDVKYPMFMSVLSMWVFRIGGAYLLVYPLGMGVSGVWFSMAVLDWGFRAIMYILRWRSGKWEKMRVI